MIPGRWLTAIDMLDQTYDTLKPVPIAFPKVTTPKVSIIIPAHNKLEVTYYALCALLVAHNRASFDVIVVDDASTDGTATLERLVSGITVIHNTEPQRFIRACNAGVAQARGDYVVLLNNDTEPTLGWLDALIDALRTCLTTWVSSGRNCSIPMAGCKTRAASSGAAATPGTTVMAPTRGAAVLLRAPGRLPVWRGHDDNPRDLGRGRRPIVLS